MAATALQEEHIPYGGIADFIMSDAEIAELEREEAKQFGTGGIANFEPIAQRMASYGRYGDDTVAHVETGELIVPRALIDQSPALKESIFEHLREMGVEDPERYVVGSGENSLNPETGMPEFFLKKVFKGVKRAVSSVAKGVSKAVSQVGKVLKKVAPIVLPIALAMTPLGAVYGAALGSGIGTLIQGGNLKDAVKNAFIAGASGAVFKGFTGKESFGKNISQAMSDPIGRLSQTGAGFREALSTRSLSPAFQDFAPTASSEFEAATQVESLDAPEFGAEYAVSGEATPPKTIQPSSASTGTEAGDLYQQIRGGPRIEPTTTVDVRDARFGGSSGPGGANIPDMPSDNLVKPLPQMNIGSENLVTETLKDSATTASDLLSKPVETASDLYSKYLSPSRNVLSDADQISRAKELVNLSGGELTFDKALERVVASTGGNFITNYAPLAGIVGLGAYAGGAFDAAPQDDPNLVDQTTGAELIAQNPDDYMIQDLTPRAASQPFAIPTQFTQLPPLVRQLRTSPFVRPAAEGGAMFPRRTGGIDPNEGTPGEDSVRALLMPGEFVMTTDAVRGAGNGNLNQGINNMYSMMRNFESKGRVA